MLGNTGCTECHAQIIGDLFGVFLIDRNTAKSGYTFFVQPSRNLVHQVIQHKAIVLRVPHNALPAGVVFQLGCHFSEIRTARSALLLLLPEITQAIHGDGF